jgi:hypothetical protein
MVSIWKLAAAGVALRLSCALCSGPAAALHAILAASRLVRVLRLLFLLVN